MTKDLHSSKGTWVAQLLSANLGMAATLTHLLLWNRDDISGAWSWLAPSSLREAWRTFEWRFWKQDGHEERSKLYQETDGKKDIDPHYREMLKYPDAPNSWYFVTLVLSALVSLVLIYTTKSTLPWWGFLIAVVLGAISITFFGALYAITGLAFSIQPFVQMIAGFSEWNNLY
jgi:hypothetical protein